MTMNCELAQSELQLEWDGELPADRCEALQQHLAACVGCREVARQFALMRGAMSRLAFASDLPVSPVASLRMTPLPMVRPRSWWFRPMTAAAVLALCAIGGWRVVTLMHDRPVPMGVQVSPPPEQPLQLAGPVSPPPAGLAAEQVDPRTLVRVEFEPADDVMVVQKPTKNPNVTVLFVYPVYKAADAKPRSAIEPRNDAEGAKS
jgi:anti-sigma factor RsiW